MLAGAGMCTAAAKADARAFGAPSAMRAVEYRSTMMLDFGKVAILGQDGTVTITPSGERQIRGLVDLGGHYGAAQIDITGEPNARFHIVNPRIDVLHNARLGRLMVRKITSEPKTLGRFDEMGRAKVQFGADLVVPSGTRQGTYRGAVSFWVVYL